MKAEEYHSDIIQELIDGTSDLDQMKTHVEMYGEALRSSDKYIEKLKQQISKLKGDKYTLGSLHHEQKNVIVKLRALLELIYDCTIAGDKLSEGTLSQINKALEE